MTSISGLLGTTPLPPSEARMLLMHVLNKTRIQLITESELEPDEALQRTYHDLVQRRINGEPIAYLIGHREFFGLDFRVTPAVLIPRPDTELLVELAIHHTPQNGSVLDLGTGSGAIAIALAHTRRDLQVSACDISPAALDVARHNADVHGCPIEFSVSDWYTALPERQWQTIVSNPPYIEQNDPHLAQGDLRFEPVNALTDHGDGLSAYRHIIAGAAQRLHRGGWLLVEHGYNQADAVRHLFTQHQFVQVQSWRDIAGIERVSGGRLE